MATATRAARLGERIRELRYRRGLTQAQVAYKAGVGEKTLKRLEGGKTDTPHPETLAAVAGALGLRPEELFDSIAEQADAPDEVAAAAPAVHQLPRPPRNFTGREAELAELESHLDADGLTLSGIHGMGGVGKTSLALVVAERWSERFPDGQLYLDLRGTAAPVSVGDAMLHVIRSVDPGRAAPTRDAEISAAYRSVLRGKRTLLVMDNAGGKEQIEALVPPEGSALLVTSRQRFSLPGMKSLALSPLDASAARSLLGSISPRTAAVGAELASLCGGLPLALTLAARMLAERPDLDPGEYTARLADDRQRIRQLDVPDAEGGVEASFELSFGMLADELRAALLLLSVFPQDFDRSAAAMLWEIDEQAADARIGQLLRYHLLEWNGVGQEARYRLHDLVRVFAGTRLDRELRARAELRHARHYVGLLAGADRAFRRGGLQEGLAVVDREWGHIASAFAHCRARARENEEAARLCVQAPEAATVLRLRQHSRERVGWLTQARQVAIQRGYRAAEGRLLAALGRAYIELGDPRTASEHCERAIEIASEVGDEGTEAGALTVLGDAHHALGDPAGALAAGERALSLARRLGARGDEAYALLVLAWGNFLRGEAERSVECCEHALPITREQGDRSRECVTLLALGFAAMAAGQRERGQEACERCIRVAQETGDRRMEGYAQLPLGQQDQPIERYTRCLETAREIGDRRMEGYALIALGTARGASSGERASMELVAQGLELAGETGDRSMQALGNLSLGVACSAAGDVGASVGHLHDAAAIYAELGNRRQESLASWLLGCAHELLGDLEPAVAAMQRSAERQESLGFGPAQATRARIEQLRERMAAGG